MPLSHSSKVLALPELFKPVDFGCFARYHIGAFQKWLYRLESLESILDETEASDGRLGCMTQKCEKETSSLLNGGLILLLHRLLLHASISVPLS